MGRWFILFLLIIAGAWCLEGHQQSAQSAPQMRPASRVRPALDERLATVQGQPTHGARLASPAAYCPARADGWQVVSPGVELRALRLGDSGTRLVALRVRPNRVHVVSGATLDAAAWRGRKGALAAINGGYFDAANHSLGLRVTQGHQLSALRGADWGVFTISRTRFGLVANIVHSRDFQLSGKVREAVQCGPRLVVAGKVTDLKPQVARRSGLGVTSEGQVVLAICDGPVSFERWAEIWRSPKGLNCPDALNLDGGGSTQLSLRAAKRSLDIGGLWPIPDALIIK